MGTVGKYERMVWVQEKLGEEGVGRRINKERKGRLNVKVAQQGWVHRGIAG